MSAASGSEPTLDDVLAELRALSDRVARLEAAADRERLDGVPEDVRVAIAAAVAAYLGHRAKVKQVHYRTGAAYAQQGRAVVQGFDAHRTR